MKYYYRGFEMKQETLLLSCGASLNQPDFYKNTGSSSLILLWKTQGLP
uniref:Uncharacterized protein n=1 Tax=viral metagenome TaxID=1070528 RepID=A0A6C0DL26_9ZZZZ